VQNLFQNNFKRLILFIIPIFIMFGCTPNNVTQPNETQSQADLTAIESNVKVFGGENSEIEVKQGQVVNVQVDSRMEVDNNSRGILIFPDLLEVELFRNTKVRLEEAQQESGGSTFVRLNQIQGHTRIKLNAQSLIRVTLETDFATITSLEDGTEFLVCQAPDNLTCLKVLEGSVEVIAQDEKKIIRGGEATYILKDKPPLPAICAPNEIFIAWEVDMRNSADTPAVGEIVANLPQEPCSGINLETADLPGAEDMVKIIYGTYEVGNTSEDEFHSLPLSIGLENYWIDIYEVTNVQYQQYVDITRSQPPVVWPGEENHPVRGVSWDQAAAYCQWVKKRLPTEAEWEVAGRGPGPNASLYPWGNDPGADGKTFDLPLQDTYAVGTYSFNMSPFGVYDMAGNVWEWVGEPYSSVQEGYKILRGGRYGFITDLAYRQSTLPNDDRFVSFAGFRCAAENVKGK
jgi:formylglycine-generating enzyme required for sulfatase activity